jgi:hypothetical protein
MPIQYTSHMTGLISGMADNLALGAYNLVLAGAGAATTHVASTPAWWATPLLQDLRDSYTHP